MFTYIAASISSIGRRLSREEEGATAVEYGLIVGLIAVAVVAAVGILSGALGEMFNGIATYLSGQTPGAD
jgi:pilus assembly protein Flp/PilA